MDYHFEEVQKLRFEVYDSDSASLRLEDHDLMGTFETTLGCIVGENCGNVTKPLVNLRYAQGSSGCITVNAEQVAETCELLKLQVRGNYF